MGYGKYKIAVVFAILVWVCSADCNDITISDGNYYDMNQCEDQCWRTNQILNATDTQTAQVTDCCATVCQSQVAYHTIKRTVIIVIASVLLFLVFLCCIFGCCGPSIQQKWVLNKERQGRKPYAKSISREQFQHTANNFEQIFTEEERDNWMILFTINMDKKQQRRDEFRDQKKTEQMNWYSLDLLQKSDFEYGLRIKGQDAFGLWTINGYFVNTHKGPTCWGLKNYTNADSHTHLFYQQNDVVFQLTKFPNGNYSGTWHSRKYEHKKGLCWLRKRAGQQSQGLLKLIGDPNDDALSMHTDKNY